MISAWAGNTMAPANRHAVTNTFTLSLSYPLWDLLVFIRKRVGLRTVWLPDTADVWVKWRVVKPPQESYAECDANGNFSFKLIIRRNFSIPINAHVRNHGSTGQADGLWNTILIYSGCGWSVFWLGTSLNMSLTACSISSRSMGLVRVQDAPSFLAPLR